jgi:hypothetical protein
MRSIYDFPFTCHFDINRSNIQLWNYILKKPSKDFHISFSCCLYMHLASFGSNQITSIRRVISLCKHIKHFHITCIATTTGMHSIGSVNVRKIIIHSSHMKISEMPPILVQLSTILLLPGSEDHTVTIGVSSKN